MNLARAQPADRWCVATGGTAPFVAVSAKNSGNRHKRSWHTSRRPAGWLLVPDLLPAADVACLSLGRSDALQALEADGLVAADAGAYKAGLTFAQQRLVMADGEHTTSRCCPTARYSCRASTRAFAARARPHVHTYKIRPYLCTVIC